MKYLQYIYVMLSLLIIFIFLPNIIQARQVSDTVTVNVNFDNASGTWEAWCYRTTFRCPPNTREGNRISRGSIGNIGSGDVSQTLSATVTKNIDLRKGNSIMNRNFDMSVGESTNLTTTSTTGKWAISSGAVRNSSMNGQTHTIFRNGNPYNGVQRVLKGAVSSPRDSNSTTLSSSNNNVISCSGASCTARGAGSATITASFPRNVGSFNARFWFETKTRRIYLGQCGQAGRPCHRLERREYSQKDYSPNYSFSNITWNVTVKQPNRPPVVTSCGASNVSYNDGRITWNYSDADGDRQAKAYVQVSTASNFSQFTYGVNRVINSNATTLDVNGLIPGTRYYFRVKANDGKVDGGWCNTGSFNTPPNNPPNLDRLSCSATSGATDYERARLEWNYTGTDEPGDELVLKARYKRNPDDTDWIALNLPNNSTGARNINDLISGFTYQVQISLNDNRNSHLGDRWKGCGRVTPTNYPVPEVTYSISKSGDLSTARTNGQTLVLKTGDRVNANWSINNGTEVGLQSCTLSTTGGGNLASSIPGQPGEQDFRNTLSFTGPGNGLPSRNINGAQVPTITADRTYSVNLNCTGKLAKTVRNVNQRINLTVQSYPIITSCIVDGNSTVQAGQTNVDIQARVGNVSSYRFEIGRKNGDNNPLSGNASTPNLNRTLNYVGIEFGRHTPWLEVTNSSNGRKSDRATCGTVANLGDSNVREVR